MHKLTVARTNNNDDAFVVAEWLVADGQYVEAHQPVAVVETSKSAGDLESEAAGLLLQTVAAGERRPFGEPIGLLFASPDERQRYLDAAAQAPAGAPAPAELSITKVARAMMEAGGLSEADLAGLGKRLITKGDIEELLSRRAPAGPATLAISWRQATIGETVSQSHRSIPSSFLAARVFCDRALAGLGALSERADVRIGLPELLVKLTAAQRGAFPFFFGRVLDAARFAPAPAADIGVTVDVGRGLFVPVVRGAADLDLPALAETLMDFRIKALRGGFRPEELSGAACSISLNTAADTLFVVPIIPPDQSAMLSLGALHDELYLAEDGAVARRCWVALGLAYDHRVINGYEAAEFVQTIKAQIETFAP